MNCHGALRCTWVLIMMQIFAVSALAQTATKDLNVAHAPSASDTSEVPLKRMPPLFQIVEHEDCVEIQMNTPGDSEKSKQDWSQTYSGPMQAGPSKMLRREDKIAKIGWNSGLEMTFVLPTMHKNIPGEGELNIMSYSLVDFSKPETRVKGKFILLNHFPQFTEKSAKSKTVKFDAAIFYLDGEGNLPKRETMDCDRILWVDSTAMQWGKCYWLPGDVKDPKTDKPYCW